MKWKDIDPKLAGIYIFKNNINGKCYIGLGVSLRKRIKNHMSNIKTQRYDLPLYRAINKYGLHNFTIDILESFIPEENISTTMLIKKLDDLEIKYIEQYESYTKGYNCTKGGDFGVLGLKMTKEQKKKISDNTKKLISDGIYGKRVYMYNFIEKYYIYAWTIKDAANITGLYRGNISRLLNGTYRNRYYRGFIAAFTPETLQKLKMQLPEILKEIEEKTKSGTLARRKNGTFYKGNPLWVKGMTSFNKGKKISEEQKEKMSNSLIKYNIQQYDLSGNFIANYNGFKAAAKAVNADIKSIQKACNGESKTSKGYIWKKELKQLDRKLAA